MFKRDIRSLDYNSDAGPLIKGMACLQSNIQYVLGELQGGACS